MSLVVVERAFETPTTIEELQAQEGSAAWCLSVQRVRLLRSLVSNDGRNMVCLYDAPDVEAVRTTQRTANLPVTHAWAATAVIDKELAAPQGYVLAVAQRAMPKGVTLEHVQYLATDPTGCGQRMRLHHFAALLAVDCQRMCCAYYAPDLESVRVANRESGVPCEALWSGKSIEPSRSIG